MVEPIQIKRFGWKRDSLDHRDKHYRPMIALRHLPSVVDLDHPPHLDQLALGSCVLNSTTAVLRQALIKQGYGDQLYSRLQLYWDVRHVEGSGDEDAGAEIRDAIKCLADTGVAPEPLWPYNIKEFKKKPFSRVYERALQFKALEYRRVESTASAIRAAIAEGHLVVGGYNVFEQINSRDCARTGVIEMPGIHERPIGGHSTYFSGFKPGYLRSTNSWGDEYGDHGDLWFPDDYIEQQASDFWIILKASWGAWKRPAANAVAT